ncbi:unnamed protein product [Urochloa humidicola]
MALQAESPAAAYSPTVVAGAFVKQYYQTLCSSRQDAYKFYTDSSILGRSDSNGNITSVTTINDIKKQLLSTDFTDCLIELETVDSQPSHVDGVLILVVGYFTIDGLKQKFTQSFFLAPQGNGYFVLNDMLRFAKPTEAKEVVANHVDGSTQTTTLPAEPDTASINESAVPNIPPTENTMPVGDEVTSPSTDVVSQVKNDAVVETCVKVVSKDIEKAPVATSAPPSAEKEVPKKTYASIVRESIPPAPAAKSKPNPRPKAAQSVEKSVSSPTKPAHATNTTPPGDKNVSTNKAPDGPGYSVFVRNLPFDATVEMVAQEFSKFGAIKPGGIQVRKYQTDRFCFGFVEFESQQSMQEALEACTVYFGSRKSYVEEKKTKTRVVDGVVTHGDDNDYGGGGRFQSGRGGYHGDSYRGQGGFRNNGYPQNGNSYQNRNGYHQNGNGYHQNGNGYQQRRPYNNGNGNENGNGRVERSNGPKQQSPVAGPKQQSPVAS